VVENRPRDRLRDSLLARVRRVPDLFGELTSSRASPATTTKQSSQIRAPEHSSEPSDRTVEGVEPPSLAQPAEHRSRDTVGAIAAMELAYAFIEEIRAADMPGVEDKEARRHHLNTLALASRQLDAAAKLDPDAVLEGQDEKDIPYRFTVNELKSEALLLEGLTHQAYDLRRAAPALVAATQANPNNARAFYVLGLTHAANRNKTAAVRVFGNAVALDPKALPSAKSSIAPRA
jgi:hypothetical protein